MRLRQIWTLKGEALLVCGRLDDVERCAAEVGRLSRELSDERGLGWNAYLQGVVHARRGHHDRAIEHFQNAIAHSRSGGDVVYRLTAAARLSLSLSLAGRCAEAFEVGSATLDEYSRRRLRQPSAIVYGAALVTAALLRRSDPAAKTRVHRSARCALREGRTLAKSLRYSAPTYLAGAAAWRCVEGEPASGHRGFDRARAVARAGGMLGELSDVETIAALFEQGGATATRGR